jgi:lipopolysaccharide export system permease protein
LVAIFATGFSRKDFLITLISGSILISLIQFYNVGFLIPKSTLQKEINLNPNSKALKGEGLRKIFIDKGKFWYKQEDYFLSFSGFNQNSDILRNVYLLKFDKNHNLNEVVLADKIEYRGNHNWLFSNVSIYSDLANMEFPKIQKEGSLLLWLHEIPQDFKEIQANISTLNFFELGKYIDRFKKSEINTSTFEVLYLDMISSSIICIIFSLLAAMPLFYPNRRGNPFGRYLLYVFFFTLIYWFVYSFLLELGKNSKMNEYFSVFILPVCFLTFLGLFFKKHSRLTN